MQQLSLMIRPILSSILIGIVSLSAAPSFSMIRNAASAGSREEQKLSQLIIKYRNEAPNSAEAASIGGRSAQLKQLQSQRISSLQSAAQSFGTSFSVKRQIVTGAWVYRSATALKPVDMRKLAAKIGASDPSVEYAEPDYIRRPAYTPNDPLYASAQWNMQASATQPGALNLPSAWDITMGNNTVIAIVDTGYRPHPDLLANLIPAPGGIAGQYGYNFITDPATARIAVAPGVSSARGPDALDMGDWSTASDSCGASDSTWHGTHVSGIAAAIANNIGVIGVAPKAKLLPLRVLGKCGGYDSDIADAVAWAAGIHVPGIPDNTTKANVVNLSLGGPSVCTKTNSAVFQSAMANGTVIVTAAGNGDIDAKMSSPANCPGIITVASNSIAGGRSGYSNYGATVTVTAPGGGQTTASDVITSTLPTGTTISTDDTTYGTMSGTSQATPHVSGVVALMLSVNAKLTPAQVKSLLIKSARPAPANCPGCGGGIVDATAAVKAAAGN